MPDETFTDPEEAHERWVDVRMTDPDREVWDVDVVVVDGRVEYIDLRVHPDRLADFVECLLDDVSDERADTIVKTLSDRTDLDTDGETAG